MVQELTQVLSPIEEEEQEDAHQVRGRLVDALFPSRSEEDYTGSQQSVKQKESKRIYFYSIIMFQKYS